MPTETTTAHNKTANDKSAHQQNEHEVQLMLIARDNPALFEPLYEAYFDRIYAYCRRRSNSAQDAEDLCSAVFTRAITGLHTYRGGMVAAWLFQIAHNVVVRHYQQQERSSQSLTLDDMDVPDESAAFWEQVELEDDTRILERALNELSDNHRDLLAMSLDGGLNSNEIGAILGKNPTAVRVQLHRVIKGLRERYIEMTEGAAQ